MDFTSVREDLGAPVRDVAQAAIDATATAYTRSPEVDVATTLRDHLHERGVDTTDETIEELATAIRSGHEVRLAPHNGAVG
jgi:hypothetical protein